MTEHSHSYPGSTEAGEVCDGCGKLLICRHCGKFRSGAVAQAALNIPFSAIGITVVTMDREGNVTVKVDQVPSPSPQETEHD